MARYEHLPIYKSVYDLNLYFVKLAHGFPKEYKYGLAPEMTKLLTELFDTVVTANNELNKVPTLKTGRLIIERLKFKARLLSDLKVMSVKSNRYFFEQLLEISRQLEKWLVWSVAAKKTQMVSCSYSAQASWANTHFLRQKYVRIGM